MSSLRRNLEWLFAAIAILGTALLVWGLYAQWQDIKERHQLRQRGQVNTIANATQEVLNSQETVMSLVGSQLLLHWRMGQPQAIGAVFDNMLGINEAATGYALFDAEMKLVQVRWRDYLDGAPTLPGDLAGAASCAVARESLTMVVGKPFEVARVDRWMIPLCKALRNDSGEPAGFMVNVLQLEGPDSFFERQATLGPTNIVQVVRESDLTSILWASALELPEDYLAQSVSRAVYDRAIRSAEKLSGDTFEQIRESGNPYPYRLSNALGPQLGMAVYDPRYRFWVLTQTHRGELTGELWRLGWVYAAIYAVVLLSVLVLLLAIGRAERRRRNDLVYQARHDVLTGLPNRQSMADEFASMFAHYGDAFSLLFVDMDNFKAVNDGFGHMQGDALLRRLGERLSAFAVGEERVARVGGDEFVVLTPETDAERLVKRAEALVECLTERYVVDGVRFELGCSIGIARLSDAGSSLSDVLRAADVAMYSAKRHRNSARLFEPAMGRVYLENIQIEQRLRRAIAEQSIYMVYQPQVDADGRCVGVEALARWDDPELGEIGPTRFIAIAEASGLIGRLGDYIIQRCLDDAGRIERHIDRPLRFSMNVSVRQFLQAEFAAPLIDRVRAAGFERIRPGLEITENLFIEDHEAIVDEVKAIRAAGICISLDDFGTGFSSLALLHGLPIDELKIDKSFIDHLGSKESTRKLIQSIVAIARNHHLRLVAEGVETLEQFQVLRADGCDVFQGFLFARPMDLDKLLDWL